MNIKRGSFGLPALHLTKSPPLKHGTEMNPMMKTEDIKAILCLPEQLYLTVKYTLSRCLRSQFFFNFDCRLQNCCSHPTSLEGRVLPWPCRGRYQKRPDFPGPLPNVLGQNSSLIWIPGFKRHLNSGGHVYFQQKCSLLTTLLSGHWGPGMQSLDPNFAPFL